jgi:LPS O-antigen subunit length determinant protein (WzzB/FepE family)
MNSRNVDSRTHREQPGRSVRPRHALLVISLTLLGLLCGSCGTLTTNATSATVTR